MIFRVVLAAVVIVLANSQQEYKMYTWGRGGGELCGRHHLCHSQAKCDLEHRHDQALQVCVCQNQLIGNGLLHCMHPLDKAFYVQSDPHIKNFNGEFASLSTACLYRLVHLEMTPGGEGTSAVVELFGENLLFRGGEYFMTKLILMTDLDLAGDMMKQVMQFYGDVTEEGNYTLIAKSIDTEGFTIDEEGVVLDEGKAGFMGYTMDVGKDAVNNLLTVKIPNLGITLLFRPPSIQSELNNLELSMVPGAVFVVDHEHWPLVNVDKYDIELSSWPNGPSLEKVATDMRTSVPILTQYLMLNYTLPDPSHTEHDLVCEETRRIFREECLVEDIRLMMLKACKPIYANKGFLQLLSERGTVDEQMSLLKKFYQRCESAFCHHDVPKCEHLVEDMRAASSEHLPFNLDCRHFESEFTPVMH